jgi:hypothetical protein
MSYRNHFLAIFAVSVLFFAARAAANDAPEASTMPATNHSAFGASLRSGETVGDHQVQRVFLHVGTNELAFRVPEGFCMDASDPHKIVLTDNNSGYFITVRVNQSPVPDADSQNQVFRSEALSRFPGAKISEESSDFADGHLGWAFNLRWTSSSGTDESARVAFIPCAAGVLEFSALARTENFRDVQSFLAGLMTSVRSNETGKLVIVPLPDFS